MFSGESSCTALLLLDNRVAPLTYSNHDLQHVQA